MMTFILALVAFGAGIIYGVLGYAWISTRGEDADINEA